MKKKITLLKVFMTLCLLLVSIGNAWGAITPLQLPKTWNDTDGKSAYTEALGCTLSGLGSDYSSAPKLKFDNQGDYMIIQLADTPDEISFNIKGNSVSGTYSFKVQESADGISYSNALDITSVTGSSAKKTASLQSNTRYIKLIYATKASGNMGLGGISITKGTSKTLTSLAVSGTPDKTTYEAGEEFDPAGLVVTGTYSEGDPEVITSGITWDVTPNPLTAGTTSVKVKATVGEITSAAYVVNDLTVNEFVQTYANTYTSDASLSSVITGSKVKWDGCKVTDGYDALKIAKGGTATITVPAGTKTVHLHLVAWNGESAAFAVKLGEASLSSITPTANTGVANNSPFTLTTEPKTENSYYFAIEVNADEETTLSLTASSNKRAILFGVNFEAAKERTLQSIAVTTLPEKKVYKVGESFDATGLVVTGTFDNGDIEDLPESKYSLSTPDMSSAGQKTVTVSATDEIKTTFTIDVVALDKIEITTAPNKTAYNEGDNFDPEGMVVKGTWGTEVGKTIVEDNLTGYTITDGTNLQPTQNYVTVSYTHAETTKTATQDITVTAAANKYAVTFTNVTEEGTLTVKVGDEEITTGTELVEGVIVSLTSTPNSGYKQHSTPFEVKDADGGDVKVSKSGDVYSFEMPANAVTITAQFSKVYKITVAEGIQGGTIAIQDKDGNPITGTSQGSKVVVAVTPEEHYSLTSLYYIKEGEETPIDIKADDKGVYSFTMVASAVSVTATFAEDAKYAVTFSIIGRLESKSNYADEQVEFPEVSNVEDYTFMGWTTTVIPSTQQEAPTFVNKETAVYPTNNNTLYYAVFAKKSGSENYVKVTSVTDGQYLIVNEASSRAFNGLDAASDYVDVEIENDEIADPNGAAIVEIAAMDGGYSLKITNGDNADKYIYGKSSSNSIQFGATAVANEISFSNDAATILSNSTSFRYNSASGNDRFRYYKTSTTGDSYILPALYKKQEATFSNYCTTVSGQTVPVTVNPIGNASFCSTVDLDFPKTDDVKAYIAVSADENIITLNRRYKIPAGTGIFVLGTGGTYNIPTTTEECDDVSGNLLTGTIVPYTVQDEDNVWALSKNDGLLYHIPSGRTIGAGKAYLNEPLDAASLSLFIVDEPTGVEEIKSQSTVNGQQSTAIFNLQGMRVSTPKKGEVYIMNGKKFLMK